jgi:hypothetical protein
VQLRQMFAEVVEEPVPRELLLLLRKADERHGGELDVDPS